MFRLAALILFACPGWASLIVFQLTPPLVTAPPGGIYQPSICQNLDNSGACVIFNGTITFTNDQDYFLTGLSVTMNPGNVDGGTKVRDNNLENYFFNNVPGVLGPDGPGAAYSGSIFEIDIAKDATPGSYLGTATLDYSDSAGNPLTSTPQSFEVIVLPEPPMWPLMIAGLLAVLYRRRATSQRELEALRVAGAAVSARH